MEEASKGRMASVTISMNVKTRIHAKEKAYLGEFAFWYNYGRNPLNHFDCIVVGPRRFKGVI